MKKEKRKKNGASLICPKCGNKLTLDNGEIGYSQTTEIIYDVEFDDNGEVEEYEERDRECAEGGEFVCNNCECSLTPDDEIELGISR